MRALLCSVVGLVALSALTVIGLAQRQNGDELWCCIRPWVSVCRRLREAGKQSQLPASFSIRVSDCTRRKRQRRKLILWRIH